MPNRERAFVVVLAAGLALALAPGPSRESGSSQTDDDRPGRADYVEMGCYQCHGYEGQGARGTGPRIAPDPLPFEMFSTWVRHPPDVMPAYSPNVLGEEKLERIHEYLRSIPPPPDVSTIPFLSEGEP